MYLIVIVALQKNFDSTSGIYKTFKLNVIAIFHLLIGYFGSILHPAIDRHNRNA